jgi:hypothetical protein
VIFDLVHVHRGFIHRVMGAEVLLWMQGYRIVISGLVKSSIATSWSLARRWKVKNFVA